MNHAVPKIMTHGNGEIISSCCFKLISLQQFVTTIIKKFILHIDRCTHKHISYSVEVQEEDIVMQSERSRSIIYTQGVIMLKVREHRRISKKQKTIRCVIEAKNKENPRNEGMNANTAL